MNSFEHDIFIYQYCDGGDLADFSTKVCEDGEVIPEVLYWNLGAKLISAVAYIHSGWRHMAEAQTGWQPIVHNDISNVNRFLTQPEGNSPLPEYLLGDWAIGRLVEEHEGSGKGRWRQLQTNDLGMILETLNDVREACSKPIDPETCPPIWFYQQLLNEGITWESKAKNQGKSIAAYIVEIFLPKALIKIEELQSEKKHDFRWTRPTPIRGFAMFEQTNEPEIDEPWQLLRFTRQILYWPIQRCIGQIDPFCQCYSSLTNELDVIQNHEMNIYYFTQMLLP